MGTGRVRLTVSVQDSEATCRPVCRQHGRGLGPNWALLSCSRSLALTMLFCFSFPFPLLKTTVPVTTCLFQELQAECSHDQPGVSGSSLFPLVVGGNVNSPLQAPCSRLSGTLLHAGPAGPLRQRQPCGTGGQGGLTSSSSSSSLPSSPQAPHPIPSLRTWAVPSQDVWHLPTRFPGL